MKDGVRKNSDRVDERDSTSGEPLYSHFRELTPRDDANEPAEARVETHDRPAERGFFANARISMGTAFPALRSVARFLTLESYRSLPKLDRLPSLDDGITEADLEDLLEPEEPPAPTKQQLMDWDELEIDERMPTPQRLYLFDVRIQGYLRQTKAQLSTLLLTRA